jgi:parallel beta-helix repeat protein
MQILLKPKLPVRITIIKGVKLIVDTRLREKLKFPIHTDEIVVDGSNNYFEGLEIFQTENGLSPGGAAFNLGGNGNTVKNFNMLVRGSFPYGYGDLFGKGGPDVIRHKKQSGFLVTGSNSEIYGVKLMMRSFGHGFYVQKNANNVHFEDCYVEGEIRKTDDVLAETSGPAFDVKFRTWTANREGQYIVTPGYMKSLCEDGFRTYNQNKNISFKNCTAKNTRAGFELRTNGGTKLENCTTIGTERAYWVGNDAVIKNSRGDANYGPLLFLEGSNVSVELEVLPNESDRIVHALATIQGSNNKVTLSAKKQRTQDLPILVGYTHPEHGESMSPYSQAPAVNLTLINKTNMPVIIGKQVVNEDITSSGKVIKE